tara:strand:+ start:271 stop:795 length:525 start_codon:yes stop_codon:yes gene_type:complete
MGENLEKLRVLTEKLSVRDRKRLQELSLYQSFFESIPVRTFVWSVDDSLKIRVKNKKSLKGKCGETLLPNGSLDDAFSCNHMNEKNIKHHLSALEGNKQTYLSYEDDLVFLTTLIPVSENSKNIVYGCSWDVTNLTKIMSAAEKIAEVHPDCAADLIKIIDESPVLKLIGTLEK